MWKWTCPKSPTIFWEYHSWTSMNEGLTSHEDGFQLLGGYVVDGCDEEHDYWDDGEPCGHPKCQIPYVRNDEKDVV